MAKLSPLPFAPSWVNIRSVEEPVPPEATSRRFDIVDIPQADDLDSVRAVVAAVAAGHLTRAAVQEATGFTERHMQYRVRAAVILGLLEEKNAELVSTELVSTVRGRACLDRPARSEEERALLRQAVASVAALHDIAPRLFGAKTPKRPWIAKRLTARTLMAQSTALRRATTLLCWRRRLMPRQLSLFDEIFPVDGLEVPSPPASAMTPCPA